jgi:hypothetical protein
LNPRADPGVNRSGQPGRWCRNSGTVRTSAKATRTNAAAARYHDRFGFAGAGVLSFGVPPLLCRLRFLIDPT